MRRREFITLLSSTLIAAPTTARPQLAAKTSRVGIIGDALIWDYFRRVLHALGYIEGRSIVFENRQSEDSPEGLAAAAVELAGLPVDVIAV